MKWIDYNIYKDWVYLEILDLVHININNPFKTWWKARKYFKRPSVKFYFGLLKYNFPYSL